MINQVRHTGIVVQKIKNVEKFYCSLGFIKSEQSFEEGSFIDNVVGLQNTKLEWVKLMAPDGYKIELLQYYTHSEKKKITKQKSNLLGCSHLALGVDNIDKVCDQIIKNGGSIVNTPALNDLKNAKVAYCHDNEGNLLEIVEIL